MHSIEDRPRLRLLKNWIYQFYFVIDTNKFTHTYIQILGLILHLTYVHYFYINANFSFLKQFQYLNYYLLNIQKYMFHVVPFTNKVFSIVILSLYPITASFAIFIKYFGPNKFLNPMVQISSFLYPLLLIKIAIEMIDCFKTQNMLYLSVPLSLLSIGYGTCLLASSKLMYRLLDYPIVFLFELNASMYIILPALAIKLAISAYLFYPRDRHLFILFHQISLFVILISCYFCKENIRDYFGFLSVIIVFLFISITHLSRILNSQKDILYFADSLEQDEQNTALYQLYDRIQRHYVHCDDAQCYCSQFSSISRENAKEWVYKFQQKRLRRKQSHNQRIQYAEKCMSHYDFKLSGLVRASEKKPHNFVQQYQIYKISSIYEFNLRKQDKNYRHGEPFKNSQEQLQEFHKQISKILVSIKKFWTIITNFDGSTKFLDEILHISRSIRSLEKRYSIYQQKYDEQLKQFKYTYELFLSIILNESITEQDEILVTQPYAFLITNGDKILNANNNFLHLASTTMQNVMNRPYSNFIPEVYRDVHKKWAIEYIEKVQQYQEKYIPKCLNTSSIEIKFIQMQHRVLPRFSSGLEIFSMVRPSVQNGKKPSFIFLVEKDTFYIKNVESVFFDHIKFKINQRNFKMMQEMSLGSIFQNFSLSTTQNPTCQTTIFPHFLQQFTYIKTKKKDQSKTKKQRTMVAKTSFLGSKRLSYDYGLQLVFEYKTLPNNRPEDPYLKVEFTIKNPKQQQAVSQTQSSIPNQQPQHALNNSVQKKQESFSYFIPYYLVLILALSHIFFLLGKIRFEDAMKELEMRYTFYLDFDYTTLNVLAAQTGSDRTIPLREFWIKGYGGFSQSFNAFRNVNDPLFRLYFDNEITISNHNEIYRQIKKMISTIESDLYTSSVILLAILITAICHLCLDLLLSVKYTIQIQRKVGALLMQFVIVDNRDVRQIINMIQNFQINVLNIQQMNNAFQIPIETVEQSALQLMKGGYSLNNSMALNNDQQSQTPVQKKHFNYRKRGSSIQEKQRVSLSLMKQQFKHHLKTGFGRVSGSIRDQYRDQKDYNINLFKKRYQDYRFIFGANKFLFILILMGTLTGLSILFAGIMVIYQPFLSLPKYIDALNSLQQSRIILLKTQTQILINNFTLQPKITLSDSLIKTSSIIDTISNNSPMIQFSQQYKVYLDSDMCSSSGYNCNLLSNDGKVHTYGIKVIAQYLQNYFREKDSAALKESRVQNNILIYTLILMNKIVAGYISNTAEVIEEYSAAQLKLLIIGSFGLLLGLILNHYSLQQFKDRIENSRSLLKIIPKQVKKKQEKEIQQLTLKEISTP